MPRFSKLFRLSAGDRRLALEALVWLGLARAAVVALPFRWVAAILRRQEGTRAADNEVDVSSASRARRVAWAVRRTSRYTPWLSNCLAKAIAGRCMLRRRRIPSTLYFGVTKDDDSGFAAHAWLQCGEMILTGGSNLGRYAVVAEFADFE